MKALSILIALHLCLSSGEQWTPYPEVYPKLTYENVHHDVGNERGPGSGPYFRKNVNDGAYSPIFLPPNLQPNLYNKLKVQVTGNRLSYPVDSNNGNTYLDANLKRTDNLLKVSSNPVYQSFDGAGISHNYGLQNDLSLNNHRAFSDDVDPKQDVRKVNNYVYFLNKTNNNPQSGKTFSSTLISNLPNQVNFLEKHPSSQVWVNEHNQNYKESQWIPPRPIWNQQTNTFLPKPLYINPNTDGYYPDNNDNNGWNDIDPNPNECYDLLDIIRDLRVVLQNSNISEIKVSLKMLFRIIKMFIINNNLQYSSFKVVVREIGAVLLNVDDHNSLREDEIIQILQEFRNGDLNDFLLEIRSHRETNLQVVVSKLALLLYRLKQSLIQKMYSEESIRLVINRAVQWSVPLVGYYFEKECKVKTQQYIVQNLEVALNVNLESVKHVTTVDELQTDSSVGGLNNVGFDDLSVLGNSKNTVNVGSIGQIPGGLGNQGNLGGLGPLGNQGNLGGLGPLGNQGNLGGLGPLGNQGDLGGVGPLGNQGNLGVIGPLGNQGNLGGLGPLGNQGNLGGLGPLGNQGDLGGVGPLGNQGNLGGIGPLGNQGNLGGLGPLAYQGDLGGVGPLGDQGNLGPVGNLGGNAGGLIWQGNLGGPENPDNLGGLGNTLGLGNLGNPGGLASVA